MPQLDIMLAYEQILTTILISFIIYSLTIYKIIPNVLKVQMARKLLERQFELLYKMLIVLQMQREVTNATKVEILIDLNVFDLIKKEIADRNIYK